jgi:hypothetical protein
MNRLVTTSRGPVVIDLEGAMSVVGTQVKLVVFGTGGWEDAVGVWSSRGDQGTLAEFMTTHMKIPEPEAEQLATDVLGPWLDEWAARGGEEEARQVERFSRWFFGGVALVVALALVGLVALVVVLVGRL